MQKQAASTPIKTFWFDLGNVILPFDFTPAFKRLSRHGPSVADFRSFFRERPSLEIACDTGEVTAHALFRMLRRHFGLKRLEYAEFKTVWNDIFRENRQVSALILRLRKAGFRLILVSNTNKLHFDHIRRRYPVLKAFHHHVVSYRIKTRKPEKRMFRHALKLSRARSHEIFYTDDRKDFTDAAMGHGVRVHTFSRPAGLLRALRSQGIRV